MNAINSLPESGNWCQGSSSSWLRRLRRNSKYAAICAMLASNFPAVAQPAPILTWITNSSAKLEQVIGDVDWANGSNVNKPDYYPLQH